LRPPGGWRIDDFEALRQRAEINPWKSVLVFCDNAGADTMGATLLARHLASLRGADVAVALVANDTAALNDITHAEKPRNEQK
jgi:type II pantothenate kinase